MKRIDTHTHPKISKHLTFNPASVTRMARMARRLGLDGIALTEHFHGVGYWTVYDWLLDRYPSERGSSRARSTP